MWLMTTRGFYSATLTKDRSQVQVRARDRGHLERLVEIGTQVSFSEISETDGTDYRYRVYISLQEWQVIVALLAGEIDYTNFKDAAKAAERGRGLEGPLGSKTHSSYVSALYSVWNAMEKLQPFGAYGRRDRKKNGKRGNGGGGGYGDGGYGGRQMSFRSYGEDYAERARERAREDAYSYGGLSRDELDGLLDDARRPLGDEDDSDPSQWGSLEDRWGEDGSESVDASPTDPRFLDALGGEPVG